MTDSSQVPTAITNSDDEGAAAAVTTEPKPHPADEILTLDDVANLLKVPVATLRKWRVARTGPAAFRLGKYVRYKRSSVDQFIGEQEAKEDQ